MNIRFLSIKKNKTKYVKWNCKSIFCEVNLYWDKYLPILEQIYFVHLNISGSEYCNVKFKT